MKKQKTTKVVPSTTSVPVASVASCWRIFFREQRNPFVRSQLITALMSGHPLETERLPKIALLDALVIASTTREYLNAEIVDDFDALKERVNAVWKDPLWSRRIFDQTHMTAASFILLGTTRFSCYEDQYVPDLVEWLLETDPPVYFSEEL